MLENPHFSNVEKPKISKPIETLRPEPPKTTGLTSRDQLDAQIAYLNSVETAMDYSLDGYDLTCGGLLDPTRINHDGNLDRTKIKLTT